MARQGKCEFCKIRIVWDKDKPLKKCFCPFCGKPLKQTSYQLSWKTVKI